MAWVNAKHIQILDSTVLMIDTEAYGVVTDSVFPKDLNDLTSKVQEIPGKVMTSVSEATEKCVLQWTLTPTSFSLLASKPVLVSERIPLT